MTCDRSPTVIDKGDALYVGQVAFRVTEPAAAAADTVEQALGHRPTKPIRLANAYCVALAESDQEYRDLLHEGVVYPDGLPIVWAMRLKGASRARRVRGPSFFEHVLADSVGTGVRHFFLGTTPKDLAALKLEVEQRYPGIEISGMYAPPFGPVSEAVIDECESRIASTDANMIWVALGTPKQDLMTSAIQQRLNLPAAGVGAAFLFLAGSAPQAPKWMQRSGIEWLFRLVTEPRRLWRRYLIGNIQFATAVVRHWRLGESY